MIILLAGGAWIVLHFLVYARLLRRSEEAAGEVGILRLHLFSFCGLSIFSTLSALGAVHLMVAPTGEIVAGLFAALALHAVYSMTFLELWSVTEGSFVFLVLSRIDAARGQPLVVSELEAVGARKRINRLRSLETLGVLQIANDGTCSLTALGRLIRGVIELLIWLTNISRGG